ncbi:MAG: VOC family protein [Acidobacteria bacterium]|nr:VOC family protein [Acidobacteriota bacterium]
MTDAIDAAPPGGWPRWQLCALDCPDPLTLAAFYSRVTGVPVAPRGDVAPEDLEWIELDMGDRPTLAFQRVPHYVAPTWPEGAIAQQAHLDFTVRDLDAGEAHVLAAGATKTAFQPDDSFRVYLDPVGHPFCLVLET